MILLSEEKLKELVAAEVEKRLTDYHEAMDKWEIGVLPPAPSLIVRRKRADTNRWPSSYEQVVTVSFEDLIRHIFDHCGLKIVIKPAVKESWELTKETKDEPRRDP